MLYDLIQSRSPFFGNKIFFSSCLFQIIIKFLFQTQIPENNHQKTHRPNMDHPLEKTKPGPVNLPNLPLEIVHQILIEALLLDQPQSGWDFLSKHRYESDPDCVLPHQDDPLESERIGPKYYSEPIQPYYFSKIFRGSFTHGLVQLKHKLGCIHNPTPLPLNPDDLAFVEEVRGWETRRMCLKTVLAMSMVNKDLYIMTQPILWRNLELSYDKGLLANPFESPVWADPLCDLIPQFTKNPITANYVQSLSFGYSWKNQYTKEQRMEDFLWAHNMEEAGRARRNQKPGTKRRVKARFVSKIFPHSGPRLSSTPGEIESWPARVRASALLYLLPNLRSLKIREYFDFKFFDIFKFNGNDESSTLLQNLIEVYLDWRMVPRGDAAWEGSLRGEKFHPFDVLPLFFLPNIKTIYLKLAVNSIHQRKIPQDVRQHYGNSSVKKIVIENWAIGAVSLAGLLQLPTALEKFTIKYLSQDQTMLPNSRELAKLLLSQTHSLRSITIQGLGGRPWLPRKAYRKDVWKQFLRLENLSVPVDPFLVKDGAVDRSIGHQLPPSITNLTLYAYGYHNCDKWAPALRNLLASKKVYCPRLKTIRFEVWVDEIPYSPFGPADAQREVFLARKVKEYYHESRSQEWHRLARENDLIVELLYRRIIKKNGSRDS